MTTLRAIHFPETTLIPQDVMGQSLLFDAIAYIIPTATEEDEPSPLCPPYNPAPLGDDAIRFGQLLEELKGNETAFYQGQMSNLALEYLETREDDTVRDIVSTMRGQNKAKQNPEEEKEFTQLWQARLLLKLAEIMRREEQEVHASLQRIKNAQEAMLGDLKGEDEFNDLFNALKTSLPTQTSVRVETLIKAWGRLFAQGTETFSALHCFTPEAAEPFMEISEAVTGTRPPRILRLPLPNCAPSADGFPAKKETWQTENMDWLQELKTALIEVCRKGLNTVPLTVFTALAATWTSQIDQSDLWPEHIPSAQHGAPALEIYLLGAGIQELNAKLGNLKAKNNEASSPYGLLAFISSRPTSCN